MKKKILIAIIVLAIAYGTGYMIVGNSSNIPEGSTNQKAIYALNEAGCIMCHSKNAKPPFYASIPIVGSLIKSDMQMGLRAYDITDTVKAIESGAKVSSTDLAKIEYAVDSNTMPPFRFKIVHWKSNISAAERKAIANWIISERAKLNANSGISKDFANEPVWPIPQSLDVDPAKVRLGSILYHHTALSGDGTVSCASCHPLDKAGVDALQTSTGIRKQKGDINAPTVFNVAFNAKQFWDGREDTLEQQAGGPPMNPIEMGGESWEKIAKRLEADPAFKAEFTKTYPDGFTQKNITDAIAAFERTLITPDSPFDRYLKGDKNAMSPEAIKGYELFKKANCAVCHSGENLGGQTFEYMGLRRDYFRDRGNVGKINDKGRFSFTKDERDMHKFKTPTLRNVALTAPYFHDGSTQSLRQAVEIMAKYQRDVSLTDEEIDNIVKFLEALTGEYKGKKLEVKK